MTRLRTSAPIIVCGMPRSGTTLAGELLWRCGVQVYSESAVVSFEPFIADIHRAMLEEWRRIDPETTDNRICSLVFEVWKSLSRVRKQQVPVNRFASKTPNGEIRFAVLDDLLKKKKPFYIYCHRSPEKIYESILRMKWGQSKPPGEIVARYRRSISRVNELGGRMLLLDVERASEDVEYRRSWLAGMVELLELRSTDEAKRFVDDWPEVNRFRHEFAGNISERAIARKLRWFRLLSRLSGLDAEYSGLLRSRFPSDSV